MAYENRPYWSALHDAQAGELTAVGYSELGLGFNRETYVTRRRRVEEILRNHAVRPTTLLEGAVGVGAYEPVWRALGVKRWVGVDISETAVGHLRSRAVAGEFFALDLARATPAQIAALGGPFDLVTAIDVLYHLVEAPAFTAALGMLAERVAPGGHLLVSDLFTPQTHPVAPHVLRRSLDVYREVLTPRGLELVGRHPVFAILGDPAPRAGLHPLDHALFAAWRITQKAIRSTPRPLRDRVGGTVARALRPVDDLLCRTGLTRGVNLELALFRRSPLPPAGKG